jgi:L-fucose dehydrogenase
LDLQLESKVVLVTGGAKCIGAAIVRAGPAEAAIPVIVDRDAEASQNLHAEVHTSHVVIVDLSSSANCQNAIDSTVEKFGRLDALVNNAGVNDKVGLEHGTPEQNAESLGRNLLQYYNMAHFALPYLKKTNGCIVNIGSKTAVTGQGGTSGMRHRKEQYWL